MRPKRKQKYSITIKSFKYNFSLGSRTHKLPYFHHLFIRVPGRCPAPGTVPLILGMEQLTMHSRSEVGSEHKVSFGASLKEL